MVIKLASVYKQNLLLEFASLRQACPEGVFVSITPGNSTLWSGILFVRSGPYMPAVLRFQISFPSFFPDHAPLITFSSDIFHPLLAPLTTHSYSHSALDSQTVSSADRERLPPGGFSLRHGFPHWFGESHESSNAARQVAVVELLDYLRKAFNDEDFLNAIPLEAAANQGAFHAWHTFRARKLAAAGQTGSGSKRNSGFGTSIETTSSTRPDTPNRGRQPGQWNWDGVWEERSRRGIQTSVSEQALFGSASAAEELIRFTNLDAAAYSLIISELDSHAQRSTPA